MSERLSKEDHQLIAQLTAAQPGDNVRFIGVGLGLRLKIEPTGTKVWTFNYQRPGVYNAKGRLVQNTITFGEFPGVGLLSARLQRDAARESLRNKIDPGTVRREAKREVLGATAFSTVADDWWQVKMVAEGKSASTLQRDGYLLTELKASLGKLPIGEIEAPEVLAICRRAGLAGFHEKALRLRALASRIFCFAIASGLRKTDPAAALVDALTKPKGKSRPAVTVPEEVGELMRRIHAAKPHTVAGRLTQAAVELQALVFQRPGNVMEMEWAEINEDGDLWTIPVGKMKVRGGGRTDHKVPLSRQAQAVIERCRAITGGKKYVFSTGSKPMTQNLMNAFLRSLGYDTKTQQCAHAFRVIASTLLNSDTDCRYIPKAKGMNTKPVVELHLAHGDEDKIAAIYDRSELWAVRVDLMRHWAITLDRLRMAKTIRLAA